MQFRVLYHSTDALAADDRRGSFDDQRRMSAQYDGRRASEDVGPAVPQGRASWYGVPPGQRRDSFVEPPLHGRGAQEECALALVRISVMSALVKSPSYLRR